MTQLAEGPTTKRLGWNRSLTWCPGRLSLLRGGLGRLDRLPGLPEVAGSLLGVAGGFQHPTREGGAGARGAAGAAERAHSPVS